MIESATVSFNQVAGLRLAREAKEDEDRHLDHARPVVKSWRLSLRAWTAGGVGFWTRLKIWDILISYNVYIYVYITLWLWLRYAAQSDSLSAFITIDLQVQNTDHDFHGDRMRPECHPHVGNLHLCLDFTKPIKAIWKFDENGIIYI